MSEFIKSIKRQVEANRQLQKNVKQLQDSTSSIGESETLKRAKGVLEKAKETPHSETVKKTVENVKKTVEGVKEGVKTVGDAVKGTIDERLKTELGKAAKETFEEVGRAASETAKKTAEATTKATAPIFESDTFKGVSSNVQTLINDSGSRYGGLSSKAYRIALRKQRIAAHQAAQKFMEENPEAGTGMVLHKESKWRETWTKFKENNRVIQNLFSAGSAVSDSNNPLVNLGRWFVDGVQDKIGSLFEETETAQAVAQLKMIDPSFDLESFVKEVRQFIIPEIMEAFLSGDAETLKEFCGEGTYRVLLTQFKAWEAENLKSDCKILDLRNIELMSARVLDSTLPVLVFSFNTQERLLFRDKATNEIKVGKEDDIQWCAYAVVMTCEEGAAATNPVTRGWKVIDMGKQESRDQMI